MKRIISFLIMAMIMSVVSYADDFTKDGLEVSQQQVTAKMHDMRGKKGGSNIAPYVELINKTGQTVEVEFIVYYGGKQVDRRVVKFSGKTHEEVFNSIDSMFDKKKEKLYTVSIRVAHVGDDRHRHKK